MGVNNNVLLHFLNLLINQMVLLLGPHVAHKKAEVADEALYLNVPKRTHSVPTGDLSLHVHSLVLKVGNGF